MRLPRGVAGRLVAVGVLVLLAAFAVAVWPQQVGARDCGNAFAAKDDPLMDYNDELRAGAGLSPVENGCGGARSTARGLALALAGGGIAVMLGGWVVAGVGTRREDRAR